MPNILIAIQNLTINIYQDSHQVIDISSSLTLNGVDYRYTHCAPAEPLNIPEPFEPDVWRRHEAGDIYRG